MFKKGVFQLFIKPKSVKKLIKYKINTEIMLFRHEAIYSKQY